MKVHTSTKADFKQKKKLITDDGKVRFSNKKSHVEKKGMKLSSQKWLNRQLRDPFVYAAKIEGYLARSAYKLLEIQKKYKIFTQKNELIIDVGCSPGSWSQVITTNPQTLKCNIIGIDLLPAKFSHTNFHFIQGDFENIDTQKAIIETMKKLGYEQYADCIICDIAPNSTGNIEVDRLRSERIIEEVLTFCGKHLATGGNFVCKSVKGADNAVFLEIKKNFKNVFRFKPKSSRKDSSEIFIIGKEKI